MPTGYTYKIQEGITFREFVLTCAKAFGACAEMRDEPIDKPIPEKFEVDSYHKKELKTAKEKLKYYSNMSLEKAENLAFEEYNKRISDCKASLKKNREIVNKYENMLKQVKEWIPPTAEHVGMKEFMIEQIESSIKFDGMIDYYEREIKTIKKLSGFEWRGVRVDSALSDIAYHAEHYEEDKKRAESRTEWIKALRKSLE